MGKNRPYYGKSMRTNFPGFSHSMGFADFSNVMVNLTRKPCLSHMMKYTIGWESYGEKSPMLCEKCQYQFPSFTPYDGFCCIFPCYGKLMGKPMHFPNVEVYHKMGILWEKSSLQWEKCEYEFPRFTPYDGFCCIFPYYEKLMGKPMHFPNDEVYHKMEILRGKSTHTMGKV